VTTVIKGGANTRCALKVMPDVTSSQDLSDTDARFGQVPEQK